MDESRSNPASSAAPAAIRLVIADIDGTLVTNEKQLTPRAIAAVAKLHEANILFALTTGRPPKGVRMLIDPLHLSEPIAAFNGGVVVRPDLTVVASHTLGRDVTPDVIRRIEEHSLDVWLYSETEWYVRDPNGPHVAREQATVQFPPVVAPSYEDHLDRVAKIVGVGDDHDAVARCEADMQRWGGERISAERSQPYYLDVTSPRANKGQVVLMLSQLLSIPAEEIATIGDQPSDTLMFARSGTSIAMGNASPEVQRLATRVTASNQEDGFAQAMEQFVLREDSVARPAHEP